MNDTIYANGLVRVAACMPSVHLGNPQKNVGPIVSMATEASQQGALVVAFPELSVTGYALDDLFRQRIIINRVQDAILGVVAGTEQLESLVIFGAPIEVNGQLFNCAVVAAKGRVVGLVPKTYLPNYGEFYEARQFASSRQQVTDVATLAGTETVFGTNQLFEVSSVPGLIIGVDVCEDLWAPIPPSTLAALAGATVLVNISASSASTGKAEYRRSLVLGQSAKCIAGQLYVGEGPGDSTTDLAWDTHSLIAENGTLLAESERFLQASQITLADLDLDRIRADRMRLNSFRDAQSQFVNGATPWRRHKVALEPPIVEESIRVISRSPYVPDAESERREHAREVVRIQVAGLVQRLRAVHQPNLVVGVSGGLDSALALLVATRAMDLLGRERTSIVGVSMPGFGTSDRTRDNALALMGVLGVTAKEIDIRAASQQMLQDIAHPVSRGEDVFDVSFENVQAGARTSLLFRLANQVNGLVLGTGDLSELALGWCTYGVGDQMSHYSVNASVPKTLVKHILNFEALDSECDPELNRILLSILDTPISPELVPLAEGTSTPEQFSEDAVGPFELQDFFLYYTTRFGFTPRKLLFLARHAWNKDKSKVELEKWLDVFNARFFSQSQFKRSAMPNGPKVGTGGNLSPRGDWRAPSDVSADVWLDRA